MKQAQPEHIYQLKISLKYTRPPIWRRIQVRGDITLAKLHDIVQMTMGWDDSHLHQFIIGRTYYGVPSRDDFFDMDTKDERKVRLDQLLSRPKQKMNYEYDFGDGWEHEILLENVLAPELGVRYSRCIGGARACPPEDCGGVGGYVNFLEVIRDPSHEEHDEYLDWIGGRIRFRGLRAGRSQYRLEADQVVASALGSCAGVNNRNAWNGHFLGHRDRGC